MSPLKSGNGLPRQPLGNEVWAEPRHYRAGRRRRRSPQVRPVRLSAPELDDGVLEGAVDRFVPVPPAKPVKRNSARDERV